MQREEITVVGPILTRRDSSPARYSDRTIDVEDKAGRDVQLEREHGHRDRTRYRFGNPGPLGLFAIATTIFIASCYNLGVRDIAVPNVAVSMGLAYGGFTLAVVGIQEWAGGNTLGATICSTYAGFWLSWAALHLPSLGVQAAFGEDIAQFHSALGIYLIAWSILTMLLTMATLRTSIALVGVMVALDITYWLLAAGYLASSAACTRAGGAFGLLTAAASAYTGLAGLLTPENSLFRLPVGDLSRRGA